MKTGTKHIIQCHCILPQFKLLKDPIFHKFVAFSLVDENDEVLPKFVQCNNCGVIHKVIDICKSEVVHGFEDESAILNIQDVKMSLSKDIISILETYDCDIATWENAKFIYDNKLWGNSFVISRERIDDSLQVKSLVVIDDKRIKIDASLEQVDILGEFSIS